VNFFIFDLINFYNNNFINLNIKVHLIIKDSLYIRHLFYIFIQYNIIITSNLFLILSSNQGTIVNSNIRFIRFNEN
jgi:energy-coupling factor transporter transmembrane protein EcfT